MTFKKFAVMGLLAISLVVLSSAAYSAVFINEILANGIIEPDSEWIEIFNNQNAEVDLTKFNISDTANNFTLNMSIPANGFVVLARNFTVFNSTFPFVNQSGIKIAEYGKNAPNLALSNDQGTVILYNSFGAEINRIEYAQSSATQENVSIGRYPDAGSFILNLSTLTPGLKNDAQAPSLNKWISPSSNNTRINGSVSITVNITDDTTPVNSTLINFNGTNFSMVSNGDIWSFLWDTRLNANGLYNITIFSNDSYGKSSRNTLFNISINNFVDRPPVLDAISDKTGFKNVNLSFNITASDPDNDTLAYSSDNPSVVILKINNSLATVYWKPKNLNLGDNVINFTVSDGFLADSKKVKINVGFLSNSDPLIISNPQTTATRNKQYSYDVDATDPDNDTLIFSIKTNASGIAIDRSTGLISFAPSSIGFFMINVSATDLIGTANQSFNLNVIPGNRLKIVNVDLKIDGKKSSDINNDTKITRDVKPQSKLELKVKVRNDFSRDDNIKIENINVKATIEGIDNGNDLQQESQRFDLRSNGDKTVTLNFKLPLNIDEGTFDVLIEADGDDENGKTYDELFKIGLEFNKKSHDLRFFDYKLSPSTIDCSRIVYVSYKIINLGREDEAKSIFEIKNADLGLGFADEGIQIDSGSDGNILSKSVKLKVSSEILNGTYPIISSIYSDDGRLQDTKTNNLNVRDCVKEGVAEEEETVLVMPYSKQTKGTDTIKETIKPATSQISFEETNMNIQLILFSTLIFALFFVALAIILLVK